ncbi:hypothetical protein [Streptomyces sp. NPDC047869]
MFRARVARPAIRVRGGTAAIISALSAIIVALINSRRGGSGDESQ